MVASVERNFVLGLTVCPLNCASLGGHQNIKKQIWKYQLILERSSHENFIFLGISENVTKTSLETRAR